MFPLLIPLTFAEENSYDKAVDRLWKIVFENFEYFSENGLFN